MFLSRRYLLLPDSTARRIRIASRYGAASDGAFDLLEKIGRDCVGAVQLLPAGSSTGKEPRQFQWQKMKLAMAVRSKNAHYRMQDIQRRHWSVVAKRNAMGGDFEAVIEDILAKTPGVVDAVRTRLPQGFPELVAGPIFEGLLLQAKRLAHIASAGN